MYVIKKYSASGLYSGEPIESFDTEKEASDWLKSLADKRESQGYDVSESVTAHGFVYSLELTHDDQADAYTYNVSFEDDSPKYFCTICGPEDTYNSEYEVDQHVSEFHVDSEDEAS